MSGITKEIAFFCYSRMQRKLLKVTANEWNNKRKYDVFFCHL